MRRILASTFGAGGLAIALVAGGFIVAPCAPPFAALAQLGFTPAHCKGAQAAEAPRVVAPPTVSVIAAVDQPFVDRLFVSGTLTAREEAEVAAGIDGLAIVELDAEEGDVVAAGQVLARLDRSQIDAQIAENDAASARAEAAIGQAQSAIDQAQAQLGFAKDDYDRAARLGPQIMAASAIEQRETALRTATAQLALSQHALAVAQADRKSREGERRELEVRLARTDVKAPFAGVVSERKARLGAMTAGAEPLFRIIENGDIDLEAEAPEQALPRLAVGMSASLRLPGVAAPLNGTVRLISAQVDKASRTGKVRIALGAGTPARIGGFASAEVVIARSQGVGVPASAVERDGAGARAMVVRDGIVEQRKVTVGVAEGDAVEIASGVAPGEAVVVRAAAFLRPGDRVRAVPDDAQGANP